MPSMPPPYANIMVHLSASARSGHHLALAAELARALQVPLIGLYCAFSPDPAWLHRMEDAERYLQRIRDEHEAIRESMRRQCMALAAAVPAGVRWCDADDDPRDAALRASREAGLMVAGQRDDADFRAFVAPGFVESLVLDSGRPVLIIPRQGRFSLERRRAVVAWDGSREAARALHDAMPLLTGGEVTVFHAGKHGDAARGGGALERATAMLHRHGVTYDVLTVSAGGDRDVAAGLQHTAAVTGANLLVMGAYGHGAVREFVLGGVTRTMLEGAAVPVLMSH